jgi:hypothetical protein
MFTIFPCFTMKNLILFSFCVLFSLFACKQETKPVETAKVVAPVGFPEAAKVEKDDLTQYFGELSTKELDPVGQSIIENKKNLAAISNVKEKDAGMINPKELEEIQIRQGRIEEQFFYCLKMGKHLNSKENSKEMSAEAIKKERKDIEDRLKSVVTMTDEMKNKLVLLSASKNQLQ